MSDEPRNLSDGERVVEELLGESPEVEAAGGSHTGLRRSGNEDAFTFGRIGRFMDVVETNLPPSPLTGRMEQLGWFAVVADGMGGARRERWPAAPRSPPPSRRRCAVRTGSPA